ncbi:MAG: type II toxin-antitoxin system Phd/YefM family antitoxin [Treponema sp.]|nr:type II toxin-antitoxin system Phd/YefM family antitoxin [Treponema sp.]
MSLKKNSKRKTSYNDDSYKQWQLQEAKAMLSEVVQSAAKKPQVITVHGKKSAVIISYNEYQKLKEPKQNLYDFFKSSPFYGAELETPRRIP